MANYPLPDAILTECTFTLDDSVVASMHGRGQLATMTQVFDPSFRVSIRSAPLDQAGMQMWTAWKAKMRGGLNTFTAFDHSRLAPLNYLDARSPTHISPGWNGTAGVASLGLSGALALSGVPVGYVAKEGDRVSLEQGGAIGLHEITADAVANGAGNLALTVYPLLRGETFTTAAVARLWRPVGLFRIDWQSWQMTVTASPSPIAFQGWGMLR